MAALNTIPTPASLRWREFRLRLLPLLVFGIVSLIVAFLWHDQLLYDQIAPQPTPRNAARDYSGASDSTNFITPSQHRRALRTRIGNEPPPPFPSLHTSSALYERPWFKEVKR